MNLDGDIGLRLINKCFESEREKFKEKMWLSLYPAMIHSYGMSEGTILELKTIDEMFKNSKSQNSVPEQEETIEEILQKTNKILSMQFEEVR